MLPASNRMRDSRDFSATVRRGRRAARPSLVIHLGSVSTSLSSRADGKFPVQGDSLGDALADTQGGGIRVGLVVSRAVGPAVVRNRVKRRLRAQLASRVRALPAGTRLVVRANPAAATSSSEQLAADLDGALRRLGVGS